MKKNKNYFKLMSSGFTLVELLAVIIILAIVALIATPIILNVIEDAKNSANMSQAQLIVNAAETFYAINTLNEEIIFKKDEDIYDKIETTSKKPEYGDVFISSDGKIAMSLWLDEKCYVKVFDNDEVIIDTEKNTSLLCASTTPPEVLEDYKDKVIAQAPILTDEMIPVKISAEGIITKADISKQWYDYENSEWANVVILKDNVSEKQIDEEIDIETEISQMYVYIPRFRYEVFYSDEPITINLEFESTKDEKSELDLTSDPSLVKGQMLTHPAFYYENADGTLTELEGFWIGKFEQATDNRIIPNVNSMNNLSISTMYDQINDKSTENMDIHMVKSMEWGAVAYLSQSKYGASNRVDVNYSNHSGELTTGCGGLTSVGACNVATNGWNTEKGTKSSTTGNITGAYDMSGGRWEYIMSYQGVLSSSGFKTDFFNNENRKYYDIYPHGQNFRDFEKALLGDMMEETNPGHQNGWNSGYTAFPGLNVVWATRGGGTAFDGYNSDLFAFSGSDGLGYTSHSTRSALWVLN